MILKHILKKCRGINDDRVINIVLDLINTIASLNTIGLNNIPVDLLLRFSNTINNCRPRSLDAVKMIFHSPGLVCENWTDEKFNDKCIINSKDKIPIDHVYNYLYTFIEFLANETAYDTSFKYYYMLSNIISLLLNNNKINEQFKVNLYIMLMHICNDALSPEIEGSLILFDE